VLEAALEAVGLAAAGALDGTSIPGSLRRYAGFTKFPPAALGAARRALDDDEAFRAWLLPLVDPEIVGEAGVAYLERNERWRDTVDAAVGGGPRSTTAGGERSDETEARSASRRLAKVAAQLDRVREELRDTTAALGAARTEISTLRSEQDRLEGQVRDLERSVAGARSDRDVARERADAAERRALRAEQDARQAVIDAASATDDERAEDDPPVPEVDVDALAAAFDEASHLVDRLGELLRRASDSLPEQSSPATEELAGDDILRRTPSLLPGGIHDDSAEAARFLVRLPAGVLVVDGYNASLEGWPDQPLAVQRRRLVEGLRNLQARTGVEPVVVFDGAHTSSGPAGSLPRSVQVRFSPPDVIADDVIVELVAKLPLDRPVVVATSDRELQRRVTALGTNVVGAGRLLGLLS
jgi:predicted RNA-binding protein with PIN domain/polyhydroxyalkanoate synthesis regulator phasin